MGEGAAKGNRGPLWRWVYFLALLSVFAVGAYLRFDGLGEPALWHDEIHHFNQVRKLQERPLSDWIWRIPHDVENGQVYYLTQMLGLSVAEGETGVRLMPAIFGLLTLPLMAFAGHILGGRLLSVVASLLLAISPLHVYFSREGRPYALLMLIAVALLITLLLRGSRTGVVLAYGICIVGALVGVHFAPILGSFGLITGLALVWSGWTTSSSFRQFIRHLYRSPLRHYLVAGLIGLSLIFTLYLSRASRHMPDFEGGESPVHTSARSPRVLERFAASMTTGGVYSGAVETRSLVLITLAAVGFLLGLSRRPFQMLSTGGMFVLPAVSSVMVLIAVGRPYGARYTSSALPAFLLLVGAGVVIVSTLVPRLLLRRLAPEWRSAVSWVGAGAMLWLIAIPGVAVARQQPRQKLDWREIAAFLDQNALDGETIVMANYWPGYCLAYYLGDYERLQFIDVWESVPRAEGLIATLDRAWLITAGFRKTGEVRSWMHRFDPVLKRHLEELAIFFYPDFPTLLESRFAAGRGEYFRRQFEERNGRLEFDGSELALQGAGWSYQERNREGISYQWSIGTQAEIGLPVMTPRDLVIRFRVLPFSYPDAPPQTLEVQLNSQVLANVELSGGWSEHDVFAPSASWQVGANLLTLRFGRSAVPASVAAGSSDRRSLSAAFDFLEVRESD